MGIELMNYSPFIYSYGQRNIAVTGSGTLNGQADANHWWNWKSLETSDFDALETMADDNVPVSQRVFGSGHFLPPQMIQTFMSDTVLFQRHGGITIGSEMTGGVKNVYARDLTMNSANLQAGHRIKTNTLRGGYVLNTNVYRVKAGTVGGPLLLIQGNYNGQTGDFPPDVDDISLVDWTVDTCEGIWSIIGASATDPVGTATLGDLTITASTAANSAEFITNLVVKDVTVGGVPVTS